MKKCEVNLCNGSGLITLKDGTFRRCECLRLRRAAEAFEFSTAPKIYKSFIEDLPFNPHIQSMKMKEHQLEQVEKGLLSKEEYETEKRKQFSTVKKAIGQFDDGKNNKPIKRFIKHNYRLYFYGDTGTMKTGAAVALAYEGGKRNVDFYYLSFHQIHKLFRYNFNDQKESAEVSEIKRKMNKADILVFDDFGKELEHLNLSNERDIKLLKQMMNFIDGIVREKERLIIMTSNMKVEEAKTLYSKFMPSLSSVLFDGNVLAYQFREKVRSKAKDEVFNELF